MSETPAKKGFLPRRLIVLSPQITILSVIAIALVIAMVALGVRIVDQSEVSRLAIGYNQADAIRPFVQLQRQTLRLLVVVKSPASEFDASDAQLQHDLVESRFGVLQQPTVLVAVGFNEEIRSAYSHMEALWADIQPVFVSWKSDPANPVYRADLAQRLTDLEFLANETEINYQQTRSHALDELNQTGQGLVVAQIIASVLLVMFVTLVTISMYRFVQARRKAEEGLRSALAAEQAAIEASRFKDQFLATMSHELRTPLNAIIGFLGILGMSGKLDEKSAHMIQRARANAERLLALINDVLDLSKIESGRLELVPTAISPRSLTSRWESQMDVLARQKGLTFKVSVDDAVPQTIFADEDAITKIATNLMGNAFKFTEKGSVEMRLKRQGSSQWLIEVQDTGIGIPAHMHQAIFESFRQVDGSSQRAYGGSGLGLAIVEKLVKAMDGTVRLSSTVGEGSTFTVTLPLKVVEEKTPGVESNRAADLQEQPHPNGEVKSTEAHNAASNT
jgi:signal transduction histidine kinase